MRYLASFVKVLSLSAIVYGAAALAFQINAGGDVEYYMTIVVIGASAVYAWLDMANT